MLGALLAAALLAPQAKAAEGPVYLIGVDAATWGLVDPLLAAGRMPALKKLMDSGCSVRLKSDDEGTNSGVIWTSIATGKTKDKHGIADWDLEQGPPVSTSRKVKALWNIASERGRRVLLSSYMGTWPAEPVDGVTLTKRWRPQERLPGALQPEGVFEPVKEPVARAAITDWPKIRGDERDPVNSVESRRREQLRTLGESLADDEAAVRGAEHFLPKGGFDLFMIHLWGLDRVQHHFLETGADAAADRTVVDRYYEHADALIKRLVRFAPKDATILVLSDHGGKAERPALVRDHRRWLPSGEHVDTGILVLSGVRARKCAERGDATTLDVAPTVLNLLGLPAAEDMDGRPLSRYLEPAFVARAPARLVPTYEDGAARPPAQKLPPSPKEVDMLRRMGYIR